MHIYASVHEVDREFSAYENGIAEYFLFNALTFNQWYVLFLDNSSTGSSFRRVPSICRFTKNNF